MEEVDEMKPLIKNIAKCFIFVLLASLPFISITQLIGLETFLDSFENPDHYIVLQDQGYIFGSEAEKNEYIIIQKSSHPEFLIQEGEHIVYLSNDDGLNYDKVDKISMLGTKKFYSICGDSATHYIYENQVIGKIINELDDNIWSSIVIKAWEASIHNLNIRALVTD